MALKWGGQTWFNEHEIRRMFNISPEKLSMWRRTEPILTVRRRGETFYEEQSLRACIARHQGGKGK